MFHHEVMQNLFALLRIEAGALEHWRDSSAAWNAERTLSPGRLRQLQACIPGRDRQALRASMAAAAPIGRGACVAIGAAHGWEWPRALAEQMVSLLQA